MKFLLTTILFLCLIPGCVKRSTYLNMNKDMGAILDNEARINKIQEQQGKEIIFLKEQLKTQSQVISLLNSKINNFKK